MFFHRFSLVAFNAALGRLRAAWSRLSDPEIHISSGLESGGHVSDTTGSDPPTPSRPTHIRRGGKVVKTMAMPDAAEDERLLRSWAAAVKAAGYVWETLPPLLPLVITNYTDGLSGTQSPTQALRCR